MLQLLQTGILVAPIKIDSKTTHHYVLGIDNAEVITFNAKPVFLGLVLGSVLVVHNHSAQDEVQKFVPLSRVLRHSLLDFGVV